MAVSLDRTILDPVIINGISELVNKFESFGSIITSNGSVECKILARMGKAAGAMGILANTF